MLTTFETDAAAAVLTLQRALRAVVDALRGAPSTPAELGRVLSIDRNLAWKAHRLASSTDPAAAAACIPGRNAVQSLVEACRAAGVAGELVDAFAAAEHGYREMVTRHAGDRASATMMMGAHAGAEGPDLGLRRSAYRAMSFLAGVRVGTQLSTFVVAPGSEQNRLDIVSIKAFYDIERIRAGAPFVMTRPRAAVGNAAYTNQMDYGAIEPSPAGEAGEGGSLPLIADFCSRPLPVFTPVRGEGGFVEDELEDRPVGRTGACTVVRATRSPNLLPRYTSPGDEHAEVSTRLRTPCRVVVLDKFIHEDAYGPVSPWVRVYNDLGGEAAWLGERQGRSMVPCGERVEVVGRGLGGVRTPDVPRYDALMARVFSRLGWDPERFVLYRVRIELPLIPATVMLVHEQAEPEGGFMPGST